MLIHISARRRGVVGVALGILTLAGLILFLGRWGYDDPYITFRYASNLLSGHGFVYNIGQRTLSTTAPLYALLLAGLGLIWSELPALGNVLSALALLLGAAFLLKLSWDRGQKATGMVAALLLCLSPQMHLTFGAETCLYVMLILGGFYAYDRSHLTLSATALALAVMVRPDGLMAAVALGLYHLARRRPFPWRAVSLYAGLVGVWYLGLWLYFGSPVPTTLLAKQYQGQMAISMRFGTGFLERIKWYVHLPLYGLHAALALVGLVSVLRKAHHWLPLMMWTGLYFLAFTFLAVSSYPWYYAPLVPAFFVLVAEGTIALSRLLLRIKLPRTLQMGLVGLLLVVLLAPQLTGTARIGWQPDPRLEINREIGQWLEVHTPSQATIGALEVGIIGYYAQRPMIDFSGLVQPNVARQFGPSTTYQDSATWAIQTYWPDYVVLHQGAFSSVIESDWFRAAYLPVRDFANQQVLWMTLYRRSKNL
jgi:hypothetical protein